MTSHDIKCSCYCSHDITWHHLLMLLHHMTSHDITWHHLLMLLHHMTSHDIALRHHWQGLSISMHSTMLIKIPRRSSVKNWQNQAALTLAVNAIFCSRGRNSVKGKANVSWPVVPQNASRAVEINNTNINMPAQYSALWLHFKLCTLDPNRLGM